MKSNNNFFSNLFQRKNIFAIIMVLNLLTAAHFPFKTNFNQISSENIINKMCIILVEQDYSILVLFFTISKCNQQR